MFLQWSPPALEESKSLLQSHRQVKEKSSSKARGRHSGELFPSAPAKHSPALEKGNSQAAVFPSSGAPQ